MECYRTSPYNGCLGNCARCSYLETCDAPEWGEGEWERAMDGRRMSDAMWYGVTGF